MVRVGLGEYGDGFPQGDPNGHDPLVIAREMASRGIGIVSASIIISDIS